MRLFTHNRYYIIKKFQSYFNIIQIQDRVTIALEEGRLPTVFVKKTNRRMISPAADVSSRNKLTHGINFKSFYYCLGALSKTNIRLGILTVKNATTNIVNRILSSKAVVIQESSLDKFLQNFQKC